MLVFFLFLSNLAIVGYLWLLARTISRFHEKLTTLPEGTELSYEIDKGDVEWWN